MRKNQQQPEAVKKPIISCNKGRAVVAKAVQYAYDFRKPKNINIVALGPVVPGAPEDR